MNAKALEAAKEKLDIARDKVAAMSAARDIKMLAQLWEEFLTLQQQVFLRLKKAFELGPSKSWSDRLQFERRTDAMLQYVEQARHANEHGIENITETAQSKIAFKPRQGNSISVNYMEIDTKNNSTKISMDPVTAAQIEFEFIPGSVELLKIKNRGVEYAPPSSHFGKAITCSPIYIADLTNTYLYNKIIEAEARFIQ
jgi:hypothetical protein